MPTQHPNIVLIMTDQHRANLCRREGYPLDTTPFLDSLARQGAWFDHAYTTMPVCGPARVSLLTGRWPSAHRARSNHNISDAFFHTDLFATFHDAGYSTAIMGKNHSHVTEDRLDGYYHCAHFRAFDKDRTADEAAFDKYLESLEHHLDLSPAPFPVHLQLPHRIVGRAIDWVKTQRDNPWFMWLSFPEPHNPYQVPEPYYSMFPPENLPAVCAGPEALQHKPFAYEWCRKSLELAFPTYGSQIDRARANYHGMLRLIDDQVRRFVESLDALGLRDNTLIVFLSDHGDYVGQYGLLRKGAGMDEALIRVPMLFAGLNVRRRGAACGAHVSLADVMPTLCEAAALPIPLGVQGRSLWPMLTGSDSAETEFTSAFIESGIGGEAYDGTETLDPATDGLVEGIRFDELNSWTQSGASRTVCQGDWKLIRDAAGNQRLYHLPSDEAELHDRSTDPACASALAALTSAMLGWMLRLESQPLPLPRARYWVKSQGRLHAPMNHA